MSKPDLVRPLDASATRMQVITGLTTALRMSALVELEGAVDGSVRLPRDRQPKPKEE